MLKIVRVLVPVVVLLAVGCGKQEEVVVPATMAQPAQAKSPAMPDPPPPPPPETEPGEKPPVM